MNISCSLTDVDRGQIEDVVLEEWVQGSNTYLKVFPSGVTPVTLRVQNGQMVLEFTDDHSNEHTVVLRTYND